MKIRATVEDAREGCGRRRFATHDLSDVLRVVNDRHGSTIQAEYVKTVGRFVQTKLRVDACSDPFHRIGHEHTSSKGNVFRKRMVCLCWHGFKAVMQEVFRRDPAATISTGFATYRGVAHFEDIHRETFHRNAGSQMFPEAYGEMCGCERDEDWPEAPYDLAASEESERFIPQHVQRARARNTGTGPWYMTRGQVLADSGDESADVSGSDDNLVPDEVAKADPDRWAEYNKRFNDLILRGEG